MNNNAIIEKRKSAYRYIRDVVDRVPKSSPDEITALANVLGGKFGLKEALKGLRDGTQDPTVQLINAIKDFLGPTVSDSEISAVMINPFKIKK